MNQMIIAAFVAFILIGMGIIAAMLGTMNYFENTKSISRIYMFLACIGVFFWNFGYAMMSLSYDNFWAGIFRSIALFAVTFYMIFIIKYVGVIVNYPEKKMNTVIITMAVAFLVAWTKIIEPGAVDFVTTAWGYWYTSKMSWGRYLQFASVIAAIVFFYFIVHHGLMKTENKRDKYILHKFQWFGIILFSGYSFDTLFPSLFHTPAIPGSAVAAFFSAMLLYSISRNNKAFGLSKENVSEYVFEDVTLPVVVTNVDKEIVLCNNATKEYFDRETADIIKHNIYDFISDFEDGLGDGESELVRVDKTGRICRLTKTDVFDRFDELLYTLYFISDVTKERDTLYMLEESRQLAEDANNAKSVFLANMSHEIRTPINAIMGMNEMISRESGDKTILEYSKEIESSGRNLLSLINDILDISKIESGKLTLVKTEYDVASLLNDSYNSVLLRAKEKNLGLFIESNKDIPCTLYGDEVRIRQIITNFLTNAVKYTREGNVHLKADYEKVSSDTINFIISVKDTGIGLTMDQRKELFSPFIRFDEKQHKNIEGTGLGLSIVKRFVDMMDGTIDVASERGIGSTFTVTIPQKIVNDKPIGNIGDRIDTGSQKQKKYKESFVAPNAKVLVVDDVLTNIKVFQGLLKKTQIKITTCLSGKECLEAIEKEKFDVIFLDHMMPGMDGIETFHIMKDMTDHLNVDTPVVMLTANAITGVEEEYLKEGFDDYLAKPIKWELLEKITKKYITQE